MSREITIASHETPDDQQLFVKLRPPNLSEFVGQENVIENLRVALEACQRRGEPLDHVLLYGPPGLGKTCLSHIIAAELGTQLVCTSGPALERAGDLVGLLTNLQRGDLLFIDEIHRLPNPVEEFLYSAMEDFRIDFVIDRGPYAKTIKLDLNPFTLIGATTRAGALTPPLRERFGLFLHLDFYSHADLERIILRSARLLKVECTPEGAQELAKRSRGTPRIANRLLKRARDFALVRADGKVTEEVANRALERLGVDSLGLDELDRAFLAAIINVYKGGPVGIEALAATLNESVDTLQDMVEPFLLKLGFLARTSSGRKATDAAYKHLGVVRDAGQFTLPFE